MMKLVWTVALLAGLGCAKGAEEVRVGIGEDVFPADTLTDWVSYAVQVSQVSVLGEQQIPPPASVIQNGEGYVGRTVTLRIEQTFWKSPGAITPGAVPDPVEVEIVVSGWVLSGGKRIRFALRDSPRIEVNGRYVIPLVTLLRPALSSLRMDGGADALEVQWGPLSTRCAFEATGDPVATADVHARGSNAVARSLSGLSDTDLGRALADVIPDPVAAKYWNLPPYERWLAVNAER